jgi:cellulose synthase (UDP-forming)
MHDAPAPFDADSTRHHLVRPVQRFVIRAAMVTALGVYAAYLSYRGLYTINVDALGFSLAVYAAEVHGFVSLFLYFHQVWALRGRRVVDPPEGLTVDVFITTYNEDVDLLRQTVRAAVAMRYPHRTFVLDDGRRPDVRALADELGCAYITRADNAHAKAGNWNNGFRHSGGDVIATFDADHVPRPDFLERTLGFFRDPRVALVQVPQQYHNLDSVQHRVSWRGRRMYSEQDAFFGLVMPGKDHWNAAFFCGTGAVLRREALLPHGGIKTDTITEDLHTSIELHAAGWKSVYLNEVLVTGLAPMDLKTFETQRLRWAEGNLKVATFINPLTARGLSLHQRISYAASLYHWTIGLPKLVFYLAPPWILFTGTFPIANYDASFLTLYLAFLATLIASYHLASHGRGRLLLDELFNMVSFFTLIRALKRVVFGRGRPARFAVTDKRGRAGRDARPILPHAALVSFSLLAMTWSALGLGFGVTDDRFGAGTAMFWTLYNLTLLLVVIRLGLRPPEKRIGSRFRANFPVEARGALSPGVIGVTADISDGGCALLWPEPLPIGQAMPVRLHFGARTADWQALIVSSQGRAAKGWYRYGARFQALTVADVDLINDSVFSLVVPDLFQTLAPASWFSLRAQRGIRWITGRSKARAQRHVVPVPVDARCVGGSFASVTRDVSETGVSLASPIPVPVGSTVHLAMFVPGRTLHCQASVARCVARRSRPGFDTWILGLHFEAIEDAAEMAAIRELEAA